MKFPALIFFISLQMQAQLPAGNWHAELKLNDTLSLPFTFTSESNKITIHNGSEKINVDEITFEKDSIFIRMPVFDSELRCKMYKDSLRGFYYNHARKTNNIISFHAERGKSYRFSKNPVKAAANISGRYHIIFDGEDPESKDAVGVFTQKGNSLSGTFLTTTGDYRYLEGEVNGKRMWLSAFDGSHVFLFTAWIKGDSLINGEFFSGLHWHDTWTGWKDKNASLLSADSLTTLKPGFKRLSFSFLDENGKMISLSDESYKDKAVIVQLMGSWCPNCMDETKFLSEWYRSRPDKNIEIIALDYERITEQNTVVNNIRRLKKKFGIEYPVLFAGTSDKKIAVNSLPMLNRVFAFPTTIYLDREKNVVKINTGFNGPATGVEYEKFKVDFEETVRQIEK